MVPAVLENSDVLVGKRLCEIEGGTLEEAVADNVRSFQVRAVVVLCIVVGCKDVGKVFVSEEGKKIGEEGLNVIARFDFAGCEECSLYPPDVRFS